MSFASDPDYQASLDKFVGVQSGVVKQSVIKEGDSVLLDAGDTWAFIRVQSSKCQAKINKKNVHVENLIGEAWGTVFEVVKGKLIKYEKSDVTIAPPTADEDDLAASEVNGSEVKSEGTGVQKITSDKIDEMREKGATGGDIIKALMENSATFQDKTEFSKQKYIKKKQKKYFVLVKAVYPTTYRICKAYFDKQPEKIGCLRVDSLSTILNFASIQSNSQVMIAENCLGMVLGAVAERLGGFGKIVNFYYGSQPASKIVECYNFTPAVLDSIHHFSFENLATLKNFNQEKLEGAAPGKHDAVKEIILEGANSMVIATKFDADSVFFALWPYLNLSSPFVVFSIFPQPLAEIYDKLFKMGCAIQLELTETWMRDYQVLPDRTHPEMKMHAASGFILTGIKVQPSGPNDEVVEASNESSQQSKKQKTQE